MILIDANLLLYAYDELSEFYGPAQKWLASVFSTSETVGLCWSTVLAFLRISTNPRIVQHPLKNAKAIAIVETWLAKTNIVMLEPTNRHWEILRRLIEGGQAAGPLIMDADIAALAIEHGATLCSMDRDFARFPGLKWMNPLEV